MISRKTALNAGNVLNVVVEGVYRHDFPDAVRVANAVMYQYYLIPRAIREEYFREELVTDGIQLQDLPEERV
jgi:hypothetical protein